VEREQTQRAGHVLNRFGQNTGLRMAARNVFLSDAAKSFWDGSGRDWRCLVWCCVQIPVVAPNSGLSSPLLVPPTSPSSFPRDAWLGPSSRSIWRHAAGRLPQLLSPPRSRLRLPRVLNILPLQLALASIRWFAAGVAETGPDPKRGSQTAR
jgi:hypothetical protein